MNVTRNGVTTSPHMISVLRLLRATRKENTPLLIEADPRTIRALEDRDWIVLVRSSIADRYIITRRGEIALDEIDAPRKRTDGLCQCGAPRHINSKGQRIAYCLECSRRKAREQYRKNGNGLLPHKPCATCGVKERYQYPSGHVIPYCKTCRDAQRKQEKGGITSHS